MTAPPTPWTARAMFSINGLVDRPQTSEDSVKIPSPMAKTSRGPEVAHHPGGEQEDGEAQRIGVHHPLQVAEGRLEGLLDRGQRHIDDGDVEQQHEGGRADGDEGPPLAVESRHGQSFPAHPLVGP